MRILMLIDRFPPEVRSAAHLFHELALAFQARGHEVRVVTKVPTQYVPSGKSLDSKAFKRGWEVAEGVLVRRVPGFPLLNGHPVVRAVDHLTAWLTFAFAARQWPQADVVLIYSPPLPLALAGVAYQSWFGAPFVLNVQDLYPQTAVDLGLLRNRVAIGLAEQLERLAYRSAGRLVVHSPGNQEFLTAHQGVPPEKVRIIYNWVDLEVIRPGPKENGFRREHGLQGRFVVSYAGLMGYAQDLSTIIGGAELLQDRPEIIFLIVGEGVLEARWKQMVADRRLSNVQFLPMQPKASYSELLAASDVCLVALARELQTPVVPGKLQSIMASGRPVIAILNLAGDTSKIIQVAQCGYAIEPGNARQVAEAILCLYQEPRLAQRFGANGRAYAEQHFSLSASCSAYEQLFREILEHEQSAQPNSCRGG